MKRSINPSVSTALLLAAWLAAPVLAQDADEDIRQEINELKKGQEEIKKQLEEIKKLVLQRRAAAPRPSGPNVEGKIFNLRDNPVKGAQTAKLTLVEFTDYQ